MENLAYVPYIEFGITLLGITVGVILAVCFSIGFNFD